MQLSRTEAKGTHRVMGPGGSRMEAVCRYRGSRVHMEQLTGLQKDLPKETRCRECSEHQEVKTAGREFGFQ